MIFYKDRYSCKFQSFYKYVNLNISFPGICLKHRTKLIIKGVERLLKVKIGGKQVNEPIFKLHLKRD